MTHPPTRVVVFFLALAVAFGPSQVSAANAITLMTEDTVPLSEWKIAEGDRFVADTKNNMGYLIHTDGSFTEFLLASGALETVRYIGRTYFAKTPDREWTVRSKEIKSDHTTFGKDGLFLRLYREGEGRTPYGIHTHRSIAKMLEEDYRFRSMGCILVSEEILDIIEATYELSNQSLPVITVHGVQKEQNSIVSNSSGLSW